MKRFSSRPTRKTEYSELEVEKAKLTQKKENLEKIIRDEPNYFKTHDHQAQTSRC